MHETTHADTLPTAYLEALAREGAVGLLLQAMEPLEPAEVSNQQPWNLSPGCHSKSLL